MTGYLIPMTVISVLWLSAVLGFNRYMIVRAGEGESGLCFTYMNGRSRTIAADRIELCAGSLLRFPFFGGIPVRELGRRLPFGVFYPSLGLEDLSRLTQLLP